MKDSGLLLAAAAVIGLGFLGKKEVKQEETQNNDTTSESGVITNSEGQQGLYWNAEQKAEMSDFLGVGVTPLGVWIRESGHDLLTWRNYWIGRFTDVYASNPGYMNDLINYVNSLYNQFIQPVETIPTYEQPVITPNEPGVSPSIPAIIDPGTGTVIQPEQPTYTILAAAAQGGTAYNGHWYKITDLCIANRQVLVWSESFYYTGTGQYWMSRDYDNAVNLGFCPGGLM